MNFYDFQKAVKEKYAQLFPDSEAKVYLFRGLGCSLCIDLYLSKDDSECSNHIRENDVFKIKFMCHLSDRYNAEEELPEKMILESLSNWIVVEPVNNKYLWCEAEKVQFRKTTGNSEKILKAMEKYIDRLHDKCIEILTEERVHHEKINIFNKKIRR